MNSITRIIIFLLSWKHVYHNNTYIYDKPQCVFNSSSTLKLRMLAVFYPLFKNINQHKNQILSNKF